MYIEVDRLSWEYASEEHYKAHTALVKSGCYAIALYCICLSLEDMLKALIVTTPWRPSRYQVLETRDLEVLGTVSKIDFSDEEYLKLRRLNEHYQNVIYLDLRQKKYEKKEKVMPLIEEIKGLLKLIEDRLYSESERGKMSFGIY